MWSGNLLGLLTCRYTPRINNKKYHCSAHVEIVQRQIQKKCVFEYEMGICLRLDNTSQGLHHATPVFWQYKIWYL